jgi:alpha,alpha-trehalose phosphorylase
VKQADLVLALHLRGDAFTSEEKARNFDYYEPLTVRDSSLSACTQAVVAAEVGHLGLAFDYLGEAALMDLHDLERNTKDGVHIASLAGTWIALVQGFGGFRHRDGTVSFTPRLPEGLTRLAFSLQIRGRCLHVEVTRTTAKYEVTEGEPLVVLHNGEELQLTEGESQERPLPPVRPRPRPSQPPGRAPIHRKISVEPT